METKKDERRTPLYLFNWLNSRFEFDMDAAASEENALCEFFIDEQQDATSNTAQWVGNVFCNPPYSNILPFLEKGIEHHMRTGYSVLFLLPVRSDQTWWHKLALKGEIEYYKGRIRFADSNGVEPKGTANMFNCNVVFAAKHLSICKSIVLKDIKERYLK